ncbi:hypothetical protein HaLaN_02021 [Haematococcus lacustris]|uniref:Uncharacterized protein n=1 Tax=Haematococcus lacustris TaxID=44745 RepID=A0A699YK18_HAELA|nr:hypothetical protein HaLaN_02021 [Haematococcus lacustris]
MDSLSTQPDGELDGTSLTFQDLTVVTDIALPRANTPLSFLVPSALTGSVNISFERVTLRLPSSCTSLGHMPVREATELLAALAATEGMAAGTTSFIHVLSNISLQGYTPPEAQLCSEAGTLVALVHSVIIAA